MALTPIPALPDPPIRGTDTGVVFSNKTAAVLDALQPWTDAVNEFGDDVVDAAADANYSSVSTTSVTIGTGSKSFTVEAGKRYVLGTPIKVTSASDSTRWMFGTVATYDVVTGALTATMARIGSGSGTYADWSISLSGIQGETGNPADAGVDVQEFTSSGTWTKPANARLVMFETIGAGGGGGGGNGDIAGVAAPGGCGGGGGGYSRRFWLAGDVSTTETVTVGAGGTSGSGGNTGAATTNGAAGGNTSVGTGGSLRAWAGGGGGGPAGPASGGKGGGSLYDLSNVGRPTYTGGSEFDGQFGAGFFTVTNTDRHGPSSVMGGGTGGGSYSSGTTLATNAIGGASVSGGAGGGGGASVDTAGTRSNGFAGGGDGAGATGGAGGVSVASGAGNNGTTATINRTGGGGGGATLDNAAAAGNGGAGLRGGGGGGGAGRTSASGTVNGGNGGNGGNGYVRITTWYEA